MQLYVREIFQMLERIGIPQLRVADLLRMTPPLVNYWAHNKRSMHRKHAKPFALFVKKAIDQAMAEASDISPTPTLFQLSERSQLEADLHGLLGRWWISMEERAGAIDSAIERHRQTVNAALSGQKFSELKTQERRAVIAAWKASVSLAIKLGLLYGREEETEGQYILGVHHMAPGARFLGMMEFFCREVIEDSTTGTDIAK